MNKYVTLYTIQIIIAACIFFVAIRKYYESNQKERIHLLPFWLSLNVMFWLLCNAMVQVLNTRQWIILFHMLKYISVTTVASIFFIMTYEVLRKKPLKQPYLGLLFVVPVLSMFAVLTNDAFHLFKVYEEVYKIGNVTVVETVDGFVYWIHTAHSYALLAASMIMLAVGYAKEATIYRQKTLIILMSIWLPVLSNIIYKFFPDYFELLVDITPFTFFVTLIGVYYALYIYKPSKVVPVARNLIVESMGTAEVFLDLDGRIFDMNKRFEDLIHLDRSVLFMKALESISGVVYDAIHKKLTSVEEDVHLTLTIDGKSTHWIVDVTEVKDKNDRSMGNLVTLMDVTEMRQMLNRMEEMSYEDPMTGVYNRKYFEDMIHTFDYVPFYPLGLLIGDINGLKYINDLKGHVAGDAYLKDMAELIVATTPSRAVVCRIGGDEFAILLPNTSNDEIDDIISNMEYKCLDKKIDDVSVGIAIGSVIKYSSDMVVEDMIKQADEDMYRKKMIMGSSSRDNNLKLLTMILTEKSGETIDHLERTGHLSRCFSEKLGLNPYQCNDLDLLSQLHDIGKVMIPDEILHKPTKLTEDEWDVMKTHPEKGYSIVKNSPNLSTIADGVLFHHERWDGTGYPRGLKGEEIPLLARAISIIDAYDVMTHERVYKGIMPVESALEELKRCSGSQFDPRLVRYFIEMIIETEEHDNVRFKLTNRALMS